MSNKFQFSGRLPGNDTNGLADYEDVFLEPAGPSEPLYAVVMITRDARTVKDDTGEVKAIAKVKRLEVATGEDAAQLHQMLDRLTAERTGDEQLPIEVVEPELDLETPLSEARVSEFPSMSPGFSDGPDGPEAA
ncbi:hypothetical protein [Pseudoclavibacter sp. RFBB5]|uniref:hypothetical protein n=1 Tax=Pseudoclavibacter sp. RFBB5 TaxID=2080574 RepID=UPI000CE90AAA|nr:hypothetical protein [Pseudoclavibacter sp. RFBB5]PPG29675.1 hypothetical protein C5B97_11945 [Pseudoclavibacter sp. RFBB5]